MIEKLPLDSPDMFNTIENLNKLIDSANALIDTANALTEGKKEDGWPKKNDKYWYINPSGQITDDFWSNWSIDNDRRDFMGIFKREEEALVRFAQIKQFIQSLNA